jgi:DNA-binding NarL/FixJ family response regulator
MDVGTLVPTSSAHRGWADQRGGMCRYHLLDRRTALGLAIGYLLGFATSVPLAGMTVLPVCLLVHDSLLCGRQAPAEGSWLHPPAGGRQNRDHDNNEQNSGRVLTETRHPKGVQPQLQQETMDNSVRLAVSDPLPMFRRGILATLGNAGFEPDTRQALMAWICREQRPVVLLTLESADDWSLLTELRSTHAQVLVIAVLADATVRSYLRAISAGAATAVPRNALPETVLQLVQAAVSGRSVLPTEVVRALASSGGLLEDDENVLSAQEQDWLRQLANGTTVARLASVAGYSERAMFRLLRGLYARIGARNRTEALMRAKERGWL